MTMGGNIFELLRERELGPGNHARGSQCDAQASVSSRLESFAERDFLETCEATYAPFNPSPRSTIALSYNCDGTLLASSHGDHSVKITACDSQALVRVLAGHRRTPWVVRFHPKERMVLASGSLDHEVRLWNAETGECFRKHTFGKPIASLSFHHQNDVLAIACGHKLYLWQYKKWDSKPEIVLKTRRSMRAVQFHPHGLPVVLTAEVMDPSDTKDLPQTMTDGSEQQPFQAWSQSREAQPQSPGQRAGAVQLQPPSMVPLGWEVPFPASMPSEDLQALPDLSGLQSQGNRGPTHVTADQAGLRPEQQATYSSVWNIIGEDQPPRVWIRIWSFNEKKTGTYLEDRNRLLLSIPDAVLCSEMGVDFSPCGRYLAATVACRAPLQRSLDAGAIIREMSSGSGEPMDWSPDRRGQRLLGVSRDQQSQISMPIAERVVFEVRMISLDSPDYGKPVKSRRVRAAQCLTSVQFSPTSEHILIGYGKKHSSLLRSLVARDNVLVPLHTVLELIETMGMSVVRALGTTEDEINASAWNPRAGWGLAYGTKEGKLRFIQ
jgi:activating molecule in BECN1-regulated autophagy protein 1